MIYFIVHVEEFYVCYNLSSLRITCGRYIITYCILRIIEDHLEVVGTSSVLLREHEQEAICALLFKVEAVVPYSRGDLLSRVHELGACDVEKYTDAGTFIQVWNVELYLRRLYACMMRAPCRACCASCGFFDPKRSSTSRREVSKYAAAGRRRV